MDNENVCFKALEKRRYERYAINNAGDARVKVELIVDGVSVRLRDFSLGGLYFFSEKSFQDNELVNLLINIENKGKLELVGRVVRTEPEEGSNSLGVAIDLSQPYNLKSIHKV